MEEKKARRQDKWDAKAGMVAKTYKVRKDVAEKFAEVCKQQGISMGGQLTKMMEQFIKETEKASD